MREYKIKLARVIGWVSIEIVNPCIYIFTCEHLQSGKYVCLVAYTNIIGPTCQHYQVLILQIPTNLQKKKNNKWPLYNLLIKNKKQTNKTNLPSNFTVFFSVFDSWLNIPEFIRVRALYLIFNFENLFSSHIRDSRIHSRIYLKIHSGIHSMIHSRIQDFYCHANSHLHGSGTKLKLRSKFLRPK